MNKHRIVCAVLAISLLPMVLFAQGTKEAPSSQQNREITVYAYDAFCGDWGPGPTIIPEFEAKTGIKVNLVSAGDAIEMLTKAKSEMSNPVADVIIGISNDMASKAYESNLFETYNSPELASIPAFLQFDSSKRLLPFDYGNFSFVVDTEKMAKKDIPKSLSDLTDPKYKDKVVLIDPRTSSVGLGLLLWTIEVYGEEGYLDWWKAMKDNALTIAEGWSSAYGLFTEGEAPLVLSYTTSPVYHVMFEDTTRYQTVLFTEGHSTTVEGVGLVASSQHKQDAKTFIDFLLNDAQLEIATANSMYPANNSIVLPDAFKWAPKPAKNLSLDAKTIDKNLDRWLTEWTQVMSK
ncbi:thiamine ABC transporter substrate binding subunit [uncultured Sphaerochaeta sp.]|uniref:thiamine ABC transporter substrate-binding protein n=1 Tax=uncultured Sphaerochaeta sp. TaxID=886478 RepID=UPI002A0A1502|nr:thiamine ABC transporter substrate binding subunit [uncultured Sphaerochaeta sp.]